MPSLARRGRPARQAASSATPHRSRSTACARLVRVASIRAEPTNRAVRTRAVVPPERCKPHPAARPAPPSAPSALPGTTVRVERAPRPPARPVLGTTMAAPPRPVWSRRPASPAPLSPPRATRTLIGSVPRVTAVNSAPPPMPLHAHRGQPARRAASSAIRHRPPSTACARPVRVVSIRAEPTNRAVRIRAAVRPAPCRPRQAPPPAPPSASHALRASTALAGPARRRPAQPVPGTTTRTPQPPARP